MFLSLFWGTVLLRPYVFLFMACYLWFASQHLGWRRTFMYLVIGYFIAWASELASIHTGFPYGLYIYIPATLQQELWFLGVPFMDSLSYVFLTYASYSLARLLEAGWQAQAEEKQGSRFSRSARRVLTGAALFVLLDVVIDPLALRGYRWFLGQIYGYPEYGVYFGVPLSNFAGWLVVGLMMLALLQRLENSRPAPSRQQGGTKLWISAPYRGTILYFGILLFNVILTFVIGEMLLGMIAVLIFSLLSGLALAAAYALELKANHPPGQKEAKAMALTGY